MISVTSRSRRPGCLSSLDLDELLAGDLRGGEREARLRDHLETCPECRGRLAQFAAVEPPPAAPSLRGEERRPPRERAWNGKRRTVLGALGVFGCAAAAILIVSFGAPTAGERTKGGLALTIFIKGSGDSLQSVQGEGTLHPGDEMRFSLTTAAAGHAVVLGLDAAPSVTVYAPTAAAARTVPVESSGSHVLPGSIIADETGGAERVFAVLCPTPRDPRAVRASALAALTRAGGRPDAVTALDTGCLETSVLLHKAARPR